MKRFAIATLAVLVSLAAIPLVMAIDEWSLEEPAVRAKGIIGDRMSVELRGDGDGTVLWLRLKQQNLSDVSLALVPSEVGQFIAWVFGELPSGSRKALLNHLQQIDQGRTHIENISEERE